MSNVISNTTEETQTIIESHATVLAIVEILTIISNLSQSILINQPIMMVSKPFFKFFFFFFFKIVFSLNTI